MLQTVLRPALGLGLAALIAAVPAAGVQAAEKKAKPAAAAAKKTGPDPVVARVDGKPIYRSELEAAKSMLDPRLQQVPLARVFKPLLDQIIQQRIVANAGRKENLQDDPRIKTRLKMTEERLIQDLYMSKRLKSAVTEAEVNKRYAAFVKTQKTGEEVHARHILVKNEDEAVQIIGQLKKGADFAKLAKAKSIGPTKLQGGDLGWFSKGDMVPEFDKVVFTLKPGQISEKPVRTQYGWHVIKVVAKRKKSAPKLAEVRQRIVQSIAREAFEKEMKRLVAQSKVQRFNLDGSRPGAKRGGGAIKVHPGLTGGKTR